MGGAMKKRKQGRASEVVNIREILRLTAGGVRQTQIAQSCNIARSTVQDYQRRAHAAGLSYEAARGMPDDELRRLLGKGQPRRDRKACDLDYTAIVDELPKKGVTLMLLWQEHVLQAGKDLSYAEFCRRVRDWQGGTSFVMRQRHKPGEKLFVDYSGLKIRYTERETGQEREAEVFVAALGASSYVYAEATVDQSLFSWIGSHCRAFEFFGGVTEAVVPDNLKSGVKDSWWYEPEINRSYHDFAEHYGIAVLPTRTKAPRDKGKVERAVQEVERWVIAPLRHKVFYSLSEINTALKPLLAATNARQMREYGASRKELFRRLDQPELKPLPAVRYEFSQWKKARVNIDYHIEVEKHWYSVPYYHVRKEVWVKATERRVEVFQNNERIALHVRSKQAYSYTTLPEHMPPEHAEVRSWTAEKFLAWSKGIGTQTHEFVSHLLKTREHPEQAFRAILGLQRLCEKYTPLRIEGACARAVYYKLGALRSVRSILEKDLDRLPLEVAPNEYIISEHANLRGHETFH
jgi:transposase